MKKFNCEATKAVFLRDKAKKEPLSRYAHEIVLESDYLVKYAKPLRKMVNKAKATLGETGMGMLTGIFAKQMPVPVIVGDWFHKQRAELPLIMSQLFINILQDSGEIEVVTLTEHLDPATNDGKSAKIKLVVMFCGNKKVNDVTRGLEFTPGVFKHPEVMGLSIKAKFKDFARNMASMGFTASDVMSIELLVHGHKLSEDYNSHTDDRAAKKARIRGYAKVLQDLVEGKTFYFPLKYDNRGRMYTLFNLIGMRPQGKLWETLMIDAAEPRVQNKSAIKHLQHIIYCTRYHKVPTEYAAKHFTADDLQWAVDQDPMAITRDMKDAESLFGEAIMVNKAAECIRLTELGEPCGYLFGKDLTNSGLIFFGASYKSPKVMDAVNLGHSEEVNDAYTIMHKSFNLGHLTRGEFKGMIMPLFNGASIRGLVQKIADAMRAHSAIDIVPNTKGCPVIEEENSHAEAVNASLESEIALITVESIKDKLVEALGVEILNIMAMTKWAAKAVNNYQTKLYFTSMDGFQAFSYAHIKYCPVVVRACSASLKSGYRETELIADMPYHSQNNGMPAYDKGHKAKGCKREVEVKNSGGFANSAHAIDAVLARRIGSFAFDKGDVCLLKHDDYITFPDNFDAITEMSQEFFVEVSEVNPHKKAMVEMHANGTNMPPMPMLHLGEASVNEKAVNFLMP